VPRHVRRKKLVNGKNGKKSQRGDPTAPGPGYAGGGGSYAEHLRRKTSRRQEATGFTPFLDPVTEGYNGEKAEPYGAPIVTNTPAATPAKKKEPVDEWEGTGIFVPHPDPWELPLEIQAHKKSGVLNTPADNLRAQRKFEAENRDFLRDPTKGF